MPDPNLELLDSSNKVSNCPDKWMETLDDADSGILVNESGQSSIISDSVTTQEKPVYIEMQIQINDDAVDRKLGITVEPSRQSWIGFEISQITPCGLVGKTDMIHPGDELVSVMGESVRNMTTLDIDERLQKCVNDPSVTVVNMTIARRNPSADQVQSSGIRRHISFAEDSHIGSLRYFFIFFY